jgi:hypothetical protein
VPRGCVGAVRGFVDLVAGRVLRLGLQRVFGRELVHIEAIEAPSSPSMAVETRDETGMVPSVPSTRVRGQAGGIPRPAAWMPRRVMQVLLARATS